MRYKRTRVHSPERGQNPRYAHRLAAEEKLGRSLDPREVVHYRNGDKLDNSPENLVIIGTMYPLAHAQSIRTRTGSSIGKDDTQFSSLCLGMCQSLRKSKNKRSEIGI